MKKHVSVSLIFMMTGIITGCGNINNPQANNVPESSWDIPAINTAAVGSLYGEDSNYSCNGKATINPIKIVATNRSDYYSVCTNVNSGKNWSILVQGQALTSNTICAFPAAITTSDAYQWIENPSKSFTPTYLCSPFTSSGAYFAFSALQTANITFNSLFIVEQQDVTTMISCLLNNFMGTCPPYSVGQFR